MKLWCIHNVTTIETRKFAEILKVKKKEKTSFEENFKKTPIQDAENGNQLKTLFKIKSSTKLFFFFSFLSKEKFGKHF